MTRLVTVVDRERMNELYGTLAFHGVVLRTVPISDHCPTCGGRRGEPTKTRFHEWGEYYCVDTWVNDCGHVDSYRAVLAEQAPTGSRARWAPAAPG